ncbi:MAG: tetratricopeptide repeat protein [Moraxellaceae bacterium]|nr:MAG: tetratricopeptide repeat protein [Moraxellaceae bacterium]
MSLTYQSQGFTIYPQRQLIARGDETIQVRSKTFALLLLLLERPGEVLSKSYLLASIWDDVKVEEPVLVQSVRELRQLFGNADVIQTYPRKGYAWSAEVEKLEHCPFEQPIPASSTRVSPSNKRYVLPTIVLVLGLMLCAAFYQVYARSAAKPQTDVVVVMPVKSQLPGNDYNWVSLGVMDQIIHMLVSNKKVQVPPSEYVFQLMHYANLPRNYESDQAPKIFEVSGATLIVETQISGVIENFRMDYKLRSKNDLKRGVIFARDLSELVFKLGQAIADQTGQSLDMAERNAQQTFHNELMARGVEKLDQHEYEAAQKLFQSLIELDPGNLYAREQLIRSLLWPKQFAEAKAEIDKAMPQADKGNSETRARLYFYRAIAFKQQNDIDATLIALDKGLKIIQANGKRKSNDHNNRSFIKANQAIAPITIAYKPAAR